MATPRYHGALGDSGQYSQWMEFARKEIRAQYDDDVVIKRKSLLKFGHNPSVGTSQVELSYLGVNEVYVSGNDIDTVSSSDNGDTQTVVVEGMTISAGIVTFVSQSITLTGQTKAVLSTPLYRVTRAYNSDSSDFAGSIYFYEDDTVTLGVPDTASKIHMIIPGDENQSLRAGSIVASSNYFLITALHASMDKSATATAVIRLRVRELGGVWRTIMKDSFGSSNDFEETHRPFVIVPPGSDFFLTAEGSTTNIDVYGHIEGFFADIVTA